MEAIATAGITRGCNPPVNDRFCPDHPVTRVQMATFLARGSAWSPCHHRAVSYRVIPMG